MTQQSKGNKKTDDLEREEFTVKGTEVVIARQGDTERLLINGRPVSFYKSEEGYSLKIDAFRPPAKTLRKAAERYLQEEAQR